MSGNAVNPQWIHQDETKCCPNYRRSIRYYRQMLMAKPSWADDKKIAAMYASRGRGKVVDHIVPLNNKYVCGLHWEGNLQHLTYKANEQKSNNWWPDMWEVQTEFEIPHEPYQTVISW